MRGSGLVQCICFLRLVSSSRGGAEGGGERPCREEVRCEQALERGSVVHPHAKRLCFGAHCYPSRMRRQHDASAWRGAKKGRDPSGAIYELGFNPSGTSHARRIHAKACREKCLKNGSAAHAHAALATFVALTVATAPRPAFSRVICPVAMRHRSMASRRATATMARLRARPPWAARNFESGG